MHAFRLRRSAVAIPRIDELIKIKRWDVWTRRAKAGDLQCYIRKSFIFGRILRGHLRKLLDISVLGASRLCLRGKIFLPPFF